MLPAANAQALALAVREAYQAAATGLQRAAQYVVSRAEFARLV